MNHYIDGCGQLIITVDKQEKQHLVESSVEDAFDTDDFMLDFFESLLANSALQWISPAQSGDLTDAPMLAILGEPIPGPENPSDGEAQGMIHVGRWDDKSWYEPILKRWAFMSYQVKSPQRELMERGFCTWEGDELK